MKGEGIFVGEKFLPAEVIKHILNLRRLGVQQDLWSGGDGYFWLYNCMPETGYICITRHKDGLDQDVKYEFGTSTAWSAAVNEYLKLLD